ncbi:6108_t:CDS:2, partial [Ambispora gerdemannii]
MENNKSYLLSKEASNSSRKQRSVSILQYGNDEKSHYNRRLTEHQQQAAAASFRRTNARKKLSVLLGFSTGNSEKKFESVNSDTIPEMSLSKHVIAGYFVSWGIYAREHNVAKVDATKLSHILYAFANVREDGTVFLGDPWADIEKHYEGDSWNEEGTNLYGSFKQLGLLKRQNRHVKVSLSIGGWTWSSNFAGVAASHETRRRFVDSSIELLNDLGLDGLDVDWEYPKDKNEAKNFVQLLEELRHALDKCAESKNETTRYLLTAAVPCGKEKYKVMRLDEMNEYLDLFYLMAYDFEGAWSSHANHQTHLYGGDVSTDRAVRYYLKQGIPSHKIILGVPMYGRAFQNTKGLGHRFEGVGEGTWEQGIYDYKQLPRPGALEHFDEKSVASYSYDDCSRELVTYDTPKSLHHKCKYIQEKKLGGTMFWELSADHPTDHERSLLSVVYHGLGGAQCLDDTPNHLSYPDMMNLFGLVFDAYMVTVSQK